MAVVDSVNGNSNNFQRNKGDRVDYPSSGVTLSDIWEFFIFYKLKKKPQTELKLDSKSQTV